MAKEELKKEKKKKKLEWQLVQFWKKLKGKMGRNMAII